MNAYPYILVFIITWVFVLAIVFVSKFFDLPLVDAVMLGVVGGLIDGEICRQIGRIK